MGRVNAARRSEGSSSAHGERKGLGALRLRSCRWTESLTASPCCCCPFPAPCSQLSLTEVQCVSHVIGLIAESLDAWRTRQYDYYQRVLNGIL